MICTKITDHIIYKSGEEKTAGQNNENDCYSIFLSDNVLINIIRGNARIRRIKQLLNAKNKCKYTALYRQLGICITLEKK